MNSYESTGKTVEEAISEGLKHLGLSIGEVKVDILEEGSKGLFGLFGSKPSRVLITVNEEEKSDSVFARSLSSYDAEQSAGVARKASAALQASQATLKEKSQSIPASQATPPISKPVSPKPRAQNVPKPVKAASETLAVKPVVTAIPTNVQTEQKIAAPNPPHSPKPAASRKSHVPVPPISLGDAVQKDSTSLEGIVQSFLQELTRRMDVKVTVHVHTDEEGNIRVNMQGDTLGILIGRRGETLDALQYLTGLHLNRGRDEYVRVTLDSEGYRAKREDALIRLATRMANRAQRTGRKVSLEPMNPYERRILHSALQNHEGIMTHSEGEEPNRHVVITLNRDAAAVKPEVQQAENPD